MLGQALSSIKNIYTQSFKGLSKGIYLLASMMLLNRMGTLILPFLTLYSIEELHVSIAQAGIASASFGLGGLFGAFFGGILTDKIGAYKTMLLSLLTATVFFLSLQYITDFTLFCVVLFISSMMADLLRPAVMSCIRLFSTEETQTRALSLMRMAFNLGFAIGPAIAGVLILYFQFSVIFLIDGLTCLLASIFLIFFLNNPAYIVRPKESFANDEVVAKGKSPYKDIPFLAVMFFSFIMLVAFFQFLCTVPIFLKDVLGYDEGMIGIFFAINGVFVFVLEMPLVYWTERKFSAVRAMVLGGLLIGVSLLFLILQSWGLIAALLFMTFISIGEIINFPFISTVAMKRSSDDNSGQYMGIVSMMFSLSIVVSPIVGTYILDNYGFTLLWICMSALCGVSVLGLHLVRTRVE